jgi:hypothetical protein
MPLSRFEGIVNSYTATRRVNLACGSVSPLRKRARRGYQNRCVPVELLISPGGEETMTVSHEDSTKDAMTYEGFFLRQLADLKREGRYRIFTELDQCRSLPTRNALSGANS